MDHDARRLPIPGQRFRSPPGRPQNRRRDTHRIGRRAASRLAAANCGSPDTPPNHRDRTRACTSSGGSTEPSYESPKSPPSQGEQQCSRAPTTLHGSCASTGPTTKQNSYESHGDRRPLQDIKSHCWKVTRPLAVHAEVPCCATARGGRLNVRYSRSRRVPDRHLRAPDQRSWGRRNIVRWLAYRPSGSVRRQHRFQPWTRTMRRRVEQARVGRLTTITPDGRPHVVPCCFVLSGSDLYSAVDSKPKSSYCSSGFATFGRCRRLPFSSITTQSIGHSCGGSGLMEQVGFSSPVLAHPGNRAARAEVRAIPPRGATGSGHRDRSHWVASLALATTALIARCSA